MGHRKGFIGIRQKIRQRDFSGFTYLAIRRLRKSGFPKWLCLCVCDFLISQKQCCV